MPPFRTSNAAHAAKVSEIPSEKDYSPRSIIWPQTFARTSRFPAACVKELQGQSFKPSTNSLPALRDYNHGLQLAAPGQRPRGVKLNSFLPRKQDPQFALAYSQLAKAYDETRPGQRSRASLAESGGSQRKSSGAGKISDSSQPRPHSEGLPQSDRSLRDSCQESRRQRATSFSTWLACMKSPATGTKR